ncbi:MAG: tetratricopeptide repeat protein [Bacteroidetes bacterium]|nr:tetratricopeptide repeat protein [Bacteroidota bacterium]
MVAPVGDPAKSQQLLNVTSLTQDWKLLEDKKLNYGSVELLLQEATERHDVLHFFLMGLDSDFSHSTRTDALSYCAELLVKPFLLAHLEGILYSTAAPAKAEFESAIQISHVAGLVEICALLKDVWQKRQAITDLALGWSRFFHEQFVEEGTKDALRLELMRNGYFKTISRVLFHGGFSQLDTLVVMHSRLKNPVSRLSAPLVLQEFHGLLRESLGIKVADTANRKLEDDRDERFGEENDESVEDQIRDCLERYLIEGKGKPLTKKYFKGLEVKSRVEEAISKIEMALYAKDLVIAMQGLLHLIQYQINYSYRENILKSCTNLINIARKQGNIDFMESVLVAAQILDSEDAAFLTTKAEILKSQGKLNEALNAYDGVIQRFPDNVIARSGRAEVLKSLGKLEEALAAYNDVIKQFPENLVAGNGRADILKSQGKLCEALAAYDMVILKFPEDVVALSGRAEIIKSLGKLDEALAIYEGLIRKFPQDVYAMTGLAEVLKSQGKLDEALTAYNKVIKQFPENAVAKSGRAELLKSQGKLEEALFAYDSVILQFPENAVAKAGRAEILKSQGKLDEALSTYEGLIRKFPQDLYALTGQAEILKSQGKLEEALAAYDAVIQQFPENVVPRTGRAELLKSQGKFEEALAAYDAVIQQFPENVVAMSGRAEIIKSQGKLEEALAAYEGVIRQFPENVVARTGRDSILLLQGKISATTIFAKLPAKPQGRQEWVSYHLGCMALIREGELDSAIDRLAFALEANPFKLDHPYFISAMATALICDHRFVEGLSWLDKQPDFGQSDIAQARNRILRAHAMFAQEKRQEGIILLSQISDNGAVIVSQAKTALTRRFVDEPDVQLIPQLDSEIWEAEFRLQMVA